MDDLIDQIYEAGVNVELWPEVLESLSQVAGAEGGVLFAAGSGTPQWIASERMEQPMSDYISEGWAADNSRLRIGLAQPVVGFITDHDLMTHEEILADPLYRGFFHPRGLGWSIGTTILPMTGDLLVMTLERRFDRGPVEESVRRQLDPLRGHLARASFLAARVGLEKARNTVFSLEIVGFAAAVLTGEGRVVAANGLMDTLDDTVIFRGFDRLALTDPAANAALTRAIDALRASGTAGADVMTFPVRRPLAPPRIAHLIPLVASSRDIFRQGDAVLIVSELGNPVIPNANLLQALFDLTPAESRVAHVAAAGLPLPQIAASLGVSHETVRSHMRSVYAKTGVAGQAELVGLVSGMPQIDPPHPIG